MNTLRVKTLQILNFFKAFFQVVFIVNMYIYRIIMFKKLYTLQIIMVILI
jgi:hypothetical protein